MFYKQAKVDEFSLFCVVKPESLFLSKWAIASVLVNLWCAIVNEFDSISLTKRPLMSCMVVDREYQRMPVAVACWAKSRFRQPRPVCIGRMTTATMPRNEKPTVTT